MKTTWPRVSVGDFLLPVRAPVSIEDEKEYKQITISLHGRGVRLRQVLMGTAIKTKNQYLARAGHFIYSRIDARNGALGIVPEELDGAVISGDFPTFDFDRGKVEPRFFEYMTKTVSFQEMCRAPSKGVTNRKRLKEAELLGFHVPLPSLPEQQRIVEKIEQVAARVREAIRLSENVEEEQKRLLFRKVEEMTKSVPRLPMAEVAPVIRRRVVTPADEWYPELGIRSFGKGTFHKDAIKGSDLGTKRIYRIEPGDLLFSNVFSWEGAIAVVQPADVGRFGSHRFITCVADPKRATAEFLCHWFLTAEGIADIRSASPGAAGRNKTLGVKKLEAIEVPNPPVEKQREFSELVNKLRRVRNIRLQTAIDLEHLIPALLDQAFRGDL